MTLESLLEPHRRWMKKARCSKWDRSKLDGPVGPDGFCWNRTEYFGLAPAPFRLVKYLWNQTDRTADFLDLGEPVWYDNEKDVDVNAVGSARREANKFFQRHSLPFKLTVRKREQTVSLRGP